MSPVQIVARRRLHKWIDRIRTRRLKRDFSLGYVLRNLNDYLLRGALDRHVTAEWAEASATELVGGSRVFKRGDQAVIQINKPPTDLDWTETEICQVVNALISGMASAALMLYGCRCSSCQTTLRAAVMDLAKAFEKEAHRSLKRRL